MGKQENPNHINLDNTEILIQCIRTQRKMEI